MTITTSSSDRSVMAGVPAADDAPSTSWYSWAGWCGLAASAAFLATVLAVNVLGSVEESDGPDDIVRYLTDVADNSTQPLIYGISGIVLSVLYLPLAVAGYRALQRRTGAGVGSLALVVGLATLIPAYCLSIVEGIALASAATDLGPGGSDALYVVHEAATTAATVFFSIGSVLSLGVAPLLWGFESRRTGTFAPWLSWTGIVAGVTGAVWFVWFLEPPFALLVLVVNVVTSLVFFVGVSLALIARGRRGAGAR